MLFRCLAVRHITGRGYRPVTYAAEVLVYGNLGRASQHLTDRSGIQLAFAYLSVRGHNHRNTVTTAFTRLVQTVCFTRPTDCGDEYPERGYLLKESVRNRLGSGNGSNDIRVQAFFCSQLILGRGIPVNTYKTDTSCRGIDKSIERGTVLISTYLRQCGGLTHHKQV